MLSWTISFDARLDGTDEELIDAGERYLDTLITFPDIYGPVTSIDLEERTISGRFDVEAVAYEEAMLRGSRLAGRALVGAGITDANIIHAAIDVEDVIQPMHERELLHAD